MTPLLSRIYFNAVYGALGGLLGWLLFGVFGEKNPGTEVAFWFLTSEQLNWVIGGMLIGGLIGYFVVSVEAIRDVRWSASPAWHPTGRSSGCRRGIGMIVAEYFNTFS